MHCQQNLKFSNSFFEIFLFFLHPWYEIREILSPRNFFLLKNEIFCLKQAILADMCGGLFECAASAFSLAFCNRFSCHDHLRSQKGTAEKDCTAHSSEHVFVFNTDLYLFFSFSQAKCCKTKTFNRMWKDHLCQHSIAGKAKCTEFCTAKIKCNSLESGASQKCTTSDGFDG